MIDRSVGLVLKSYYEYAMELTKITRNINLNEISNEVKQQAD